MAGESEGRIGWPITPADRVAPGITPAQPPAAEPCVAAALLRPDELAVALGEEVVALGVLEDVVDPGPVGRVQGGLDAGSTGRRDRGGREARVAAGVVRRGALEVDV